MKYLKLFRKSEKKNADVSSKNNELSNEIEQNISLLKSEFGNCGDLNINVLVSENHDVKYAVVYINSLVDMSIINSLSIELAEIMGSDRSLEETESFEKLSSHLSRFRIVYSGYDIDSLCDQLVKGNTVLLGNGNKNYVAIHSYSEQGRSVQEPSSQTVIRGPKEGFTEKLLVNIALIRKRIRNKYLRVDNLTLGYVSNTQVTLIYIDKIVNTDILAEIKRRLEKVEIDGILDSNYIEELIKDDRYSIFPTIQNTEKPDAAAASLLEGRIVILVDGSPFVLVAPALVFDFVQSTEDYYHNFIIASSMRLLRYVSLILTLLIPSLFIALTTYHQEMIPTPLLISLAAQREPVPFPAFPEVLLMEATFEVLREAGIRMPRAIGPSISIVGALVLGQAAVEAGIVSAAVVIIVSITAITSFVMPNYSLSNAIRLLRFVFIFLAAAFGLYGIFMGLIALVLHLAKLKSIGIPYITPVAPMFKHKRKDVFIRSPLWKLAFRPQGISDASTPKVTDTNPVNRNQKSKPEFKE